ncbi:MAG: 2-amino-4-hydroxy-6-hydroxymethyldihydropteridine diphosphokinase [Burkholderiales bacterium]
MPRSTIERPAPVLAGIGLGANLGDARAALDAAQRALATLRGTTLRAASSIYKSAPIDSSGPDYLNAVVLLDTRLMPLELLAELQRIERAHGRERPYRNAPRTLDLDLLFHGVHQTAMPSLTLPHPRLHERAFVLLPLAELAPGLLIPGRGVVDDLLAGVADQRIDKLPPC